MQHAGQRGPDFHLEAAFAVLGTGKLAEVGLMCVHVGTELQVAPPEKGSNLWVAEAQGGGGRRLAGLAHHLVPLRVSTMSHQSDFYLHLLKHVSQLSGGQRSHCWHTSLGEF